MDVDIHRLRIHLQPDEVGGGVSFRKIFFVGLHHSLVQIGAAEIASVHEEILVRDRLAGGVRAREESAYAHYGGVGVDVDQIPGDIRSHKVQYPEFQGLGRTEAEDVAPVRVEREAQVRTGDGYAGEFLHYVPEFHRVALEKLAAGGRVVEEIAYEEVASGRSRDRGGLDGCGVAYGDLRAGFVRRATRLERDLRHRRDAGQGLSAETVAGNALQVGRFGYLGSRMPLEAEHGIRRAHSRAVVDDLDAGAAGILHYHVHLGGTGVHRILHQFLDDGCGPLHHLTGGDHVGNVCRQNFQFSHYSIE